MNSQNFVVTRRPRLAEITEHLQMDFADYERRLTSLQGAFQLIQQAYTPPGSFTQFITTIFDTPRGWKLFGLARQSVSSLPAGCSPSAHEV